MSEGNKSVILPMFSGKDDEFQTWWTKFMAFATAKGVAQALKKEADLPASQNEALNETEDADKPKIKARNRNSIAMSYLVSAFKSEADLSLAYEAMDDDWPGGQAHLVVTALKEVYQPSDSITEVELYKKLNKVEMKKKDDPKSLFEQIAKIKNWYNNGNRKVPDAQLIAIVLSKAPKEYASVLTSEQEKRGNQLTLTNMRAVMNKYYRQVYKKTESTDKNDEMQLVGAGSGGKNSKKGKFKGKCHNCGKQGHMAKDCWMDPKNADKRPEWFKPSEVSAAASGEKQKSDELQLVNVRWGKYAEAFAEDDDDFDY